MKRLKYTLLALAWLGSIAAYCAPSQSASAPAMADPLPPLRTFDTCASVGHAPECLENEAALVRSFNRVVQPLWDEADAATRAKCVAKSDLMGDMISCLEGH
jgi:hypothetical protein